MTKVSVSSPLTSRPVVKGKAPRSKQERGQAAAITAAQYRYKVQLLGEKMASTRRRKASLLTADQTL